MGSTLAYPGRPPGSAAPGHSPLRVGVTVGSALLLLPPMVVAWVRVAEPGSSLVAHIFAVETVLIVVTQMAISILVVRTTPALGIVRALTPAVVAGLVVATGDVAGWSLAFETSPTAEIVLSIVAYDVVLGVALALPVVVVLRARELCLLAARREDIDASVNGLIAAYQGVLVDSTYTAGRVCARMLHLRTLLAHQLLLRHIRRTLEAMQRGYAKLAVERRLDGVEARERKAIDDYLLSVPSISRVVPIPTVASVFVLWKLVPGLVAIAAAVAAWLSRGSWGLTDVSEPIERIVPHELASLVIDAVALMITFPLLMLVLWPAIHRRDELLARYKVCEAEVILMDDRLRVPRRSRRIEYVLAGLPALPLVLCGGMILAYALAGLFVYPSPGGPFGGLVKRADLMHLGPVTGAVVAQPFLVLAAVWIAWIVKT
jgi:hypothetical protein